MNINNIAKISLILVLALSLSCSRQPKDFVLQGNISNAQGKYIKIMDMTQSGFPVDSIKVDQEGIFSYTKFINQPADYILYFEPSQSIRITPMPEELIRIYANADDFVGSYDVAGSKSSKIISEYTKYLQKLRVELDSVSAFYMRNQASADIDTIIKISRKRSDSIFNLGKQYLKKVIKTNPSGMESYVALAQKLTYKLNFFTLENDMPYFIMVDTAFTNAYDTAKVSLMLSDYVKRGIHNNKLKRKKSYLQNGSIAPEISLPNPYGDTLKLSALRGKYVLVDFWGSWCRPCRQENKNIRKCYNRFRRYGFEVYQVALEYDKANWKNSIREDHLWWKYQVSELKYMDSKTAKAYKITQIPANFLLDKDGKIIARNLYDENLTKKLEELFLQQAKN